MFRLFIMSEQNKFRVKFSDSTSEDFDCLEVLPDGLLKVSTIPLRRTTLAGQ
jgi:hypothetical protein